VRCQVCKKARANITKDVQIADAKRQWKKRNRNKMPQENYRRIMKGYEPHEPTTIGEQLFYILWCIFCALKILGRRISGELGVKNK